MEESFAEAEIEFVRKNKKKKYKCIALLYYQPSHLSHVISFCLFTPFKSVGCYLDYMVSTRESLNKIDLCNEDKDSLSGRGIGLLLLRLVQAYIVRSDVSDSPAIYVDAMNFTQSSTFYSQLGFERIQQRDFPKEMRGHRRLLNRPLLTSMRITEGLPKLLELLRPYNARNIEFFPLLKTFDDAEDFVSAPKLQRDVSKLISHQLVESSYTDREIAKLCKGSEEGKKVLKNSRKS